MGMPLGQRNPRRASNPGARGLNWPEDGQPERVTITLGTDCLCRLLGEHQLYVEDFSCVDEYSRSCVRKLLLTLLNRMGRER